MRGNPVARFVTIASVTMAASGNLTARPQQAFSNDRPVYTAPSSIETPQPNRLLRVHEQKQDWLLRGETVAKTASKRFFSDQKEIWESPLRIKPAEAEWLVPIVGITTGLILTDANFSRSLSNSPGTLNLFQNMRNGSLAALGAASGGIYLWSTRTHDPHQRETGLLAGEAAMDSLIVTQGIKFVAGRERPNQGNGQGYFFQGGTSFPSSHSAAAWAAAGILAHEYSGPMTKLLVYGLATTVSVASVGSKQHFPSDVLIGSGVGWLVSEYVYRAHHRPELGGSSWDPIAALIHDNESGPADYPGSAYVPLDSWVYPAFDRLGALGYLNNGFQGTRPWSREQCAHLLIEVNEALGTSSATAAQIDSQVRALVIALHREFAREEATFTGENKSAELNSFYTRILSASGTVLDDGYHLGQTIAYDFGRPFRRGSNFIAGGSASGTHGSLFFYISGEYQQAPSAPALSAAEIQFITNRDKAPPSSETPFSPIHRFQLLDAYGGINLHGWQISFGNQNLSWGPGKGGSLLLSDNAAPFPMLRISPDGPFDVPLLSKVLGPFSFDQFYGRVDGHGGASQPWIYGQKVSFKPFRSLEFAYGRTTLIGGTGHPLTTSKFFLSMLGRVDASENSVPGDSRTSVEWTWRVPGAHDWLTFYGELEDDDDLIPFQNLTKSVLRPGLYLPRLPLLPKWDLHFEWTSSTTPGRATFQNHGDLNYWNLDYPGGYTNNGNLMGNTVGREGVVLQAWTRYWIAPRQTLDFSWKRSRVLSDYIPGGGKWQDFQTSYSLTSRTGLYVKSVFQFEHISSFPLLFPGSRNNVTASIEIGFLPQWAKRQSRSGETSSIQVSPTLGEPSR
jgi:membrane-associated phospholipid phosphatase